MFCLYNSLFIGVFGSGVYLSIYVVQAQHVLIYVSISKATYLNMCLRNRRLRMAGGGENRICILPTPDYEYRFFFFILRNHLKQPYFCFVLRRVDQYWIFIKYNGFTVCFFLDNRDLESSICNNSDKKRIISGRSIDCTIETIILTHL